MEAYKCEDEFMVGDKLLVAPVLVQGAMSRSVFLPEGKWRDGNTGTIYDGPKKVEIQVKFINIYCPMNAKSNYFLGTNFCTATFWKNFEVKLQSTPKSNTNSGNRKII